MHNESTNEAAIKLRQSTSIYLWTAIFALALFAAFEFAALRRLAERIEGLESEPPSEMHEPRFVRDFKLGTTVQRGVGTLSPEQYQAATKT